MTVLRDKIVVKEGKVEYICKEITIYGNTNIIHIHGKNISYTKNENGNDDHITAKPIQISLHGKNEFTKSRNPYNFVPPNELPQQFEQNPQIVNLNNAIVVKF